MTCWRTPRRPLGENGARSHQLSKPGERAWPKAGATRFIAIRRKASRLRLWRCRKAHQDGGLGRVGERGVYAARRALRMLPVGPGTGQVVPARTTRGVRRRDVRGQGCSSRLGAGGPSLEAP